MSIWPFLGAGVLEEREMRAMQMQDIHTANALPSH